VLELDELWSFVGSRAEVHWIWLAQCRRTRQIVACAIGDRSEWTGRQLWQALPKGYRNKRTYTDLWRAYTQVVPAWHHWPTGKGEGQTCHIERFNNTLRQRLARLVRKTLSFSKCPKMHENCLRLFLHEHNQRCIRQVNKTTATTK